MIGRNPPHHREPAPSSIDRGPRPSAYFDVDGMLGHLAKWLRILGFDAAYPCSGPRPGRLFVTTRKSRLGPGVIVVSEEKSREQLDQTLDQAGIQAKPDLIFSRCIVCNVPVREIDKELVEGRVPEKIFEAVSSFCHCEICGRVYWDGSHLTRIKKRLSEYPNS